MQENPCRTRSHMTFTTRSGERTACIARLAISASDSPLRDLHGRGSYCCCLRTPFARHWGVQNFLSPNHAQQLMPDAMCALSAHMLSRNCFRRESVSMAISTHVLQASVSPDCVSPNAHGRLILLLDPAEPGVSPLLYMQIGQTVHGKRIISPGSCF